MAERTIVIVDDNAEFRRSAHWWLASAGYDVVDFEGPEAALDALPARPRAQPTCLLLDVRMPGMSGLDLHERLRERGVALPVVYMTGHGDVPLAVQAMQQGAVSFLEKPFAEEALEQALARAFDGPPPQAHAASAEAAAPAVPPPPEPAQAAWQARLASLTPRERELLDWVAAGKFNKTIADLMGISIKTVELHRKRMMDKLQARSLAQLMKMLITGRAA